MSVPTLSPTSAISKSILPATGTADNVSSALPFGIYSGSNDFVTGAASQVKYVYKKLGGDVLDIELTEGNVYAAYEEAVLEYSYIVNIHQAKNVMSDVLGDTTGTFDQYGEYKASAFSSSMDGDNVALKYTRTSFGYARRYAEAAGHEAGVGGLQTIYSASIDLEDGIQDYDLQQILNAKTGTTFDGKIKGKKVLVHKVFYKSPRAVWRFYGYYGGLVSIGNLSTYGQYADDSTFQIIPTWQNKAQAAGYEDAIRTRTSNYSYEIRNNMLRVFPNPTRFDDKMWVEFSVAEDAWEESADRKHGADGINNMNALPFANIPFQNINSMGKQWIRRFSLALCKEMLGQIRGKFATIPIPGESVTLNASDLLSQAKEEQEKLREELKVTLDELTYAKLAEQDAAVADHAQKVFQNVPNVIFMG